jgi:hypothetical protein
MSAENLPDEEPKKDEGKIELDNIKYYLQILGVIFIFYLISNTVAFTGMIIVILVLLYYKKEIVFEKIKLWFK